MIPTGHRAYGQRFRGPTNVKMRAVNLVHAPSSSWDGMWTTAYDPTGFLHKAVDVAKTAGANAVKVTMPTVPYVTGGAAATTATSRYIAFLDYVASKGLGCYVNTENRGNTYTAAQLASASASVCALLDPYPNVTGVDLYNEPDAIGATSSSVISTFCAAAFPAVRAVTSIPLTVSLARDHPADWGLETGNGYTNAIAPWVDFWDFHVYHLKNKFTANVYPAVADVALFRARSTYKPWVIGEIGSPSRVTDSAFFYTGATEQTAMYEVAASFSALPDSLGAVAFCLTDYDAEMFGMFPDVNSPGRSQVTTPFAAWRGVL